MEFDEGISSVRTTSCFRPDFVSYNSVSTNAINYSSIDERIANKQICNSVNRVGTTQRPSQTNTTTTTFLPSAKMVSVDTHANRKTHKL